MKRKKETRNLPGFLPKVCRRTVLETNKNHRRAASLAGDVDSLPARSLSLFSDSLCLCLATAPRCFNQRR
ncbi:hypothetical protein Hanom_Chr09g00819751 [Helianthus anomalus]